MEGIKVYLACPYSHPDFEIRKKRVRMADRAAAFLMAKGFVVFSPISHSSRIARYLEEKPRTEECEFWLRQDAPWLESSDQLWILMVEGWEESIGIWWERGFARAKGIKEVFLVWQEVVEWEVANYHR